MPEQMASSAVSDIFVVSAAAVCFVGALEEAHQMI